VLTAEGYELETLKRPFDVRHVIKASRLKAFLARWRRSSASSAAAPWIQDHRRLRHLSVQSTTEPPQTTMRSRVVRGDQDFAIRRGDVKTLLWLLRTGTRVVHVQWLVDRSADLLFVRLLRLFGVAVVVTGPRCAAAR
jgi:hypothetical protein